MAKYYIHSGNLKLIISSKNEETAILQFLNQYADDRSFTYHLNKHIFVNETGFESDCSSYSTVDYLLKALNVNKDKIKEIDRKIQEIENDFCD